jgi:YD repeat-containing protein
MFPGKKAAAACVAVAAGWAGLGQAGTASAQTDGSVGYSYKTVTITGEARSELNGINASGAYAGEGLNSTYTGIKLFVASPSGQLTFYQLPFKDLSTTAPFYESAAGMDNAGEVVGIWTDTDGRTHGFERRADGKITEINDPSASEVTNAGTAVEGISADGTVIVGGYYDSTLALHGFLLQGGKFTTYDVPGAADTELTLYDHGTYGGYYVSSTGAEFGFYVKCGKLHTVAAPGEANPAAGFGTELTGISADGTLFGDVFPAGNPIYGFSLADGTYSTIKDPNQVGTTDLDGTAVNSASTTGVAVGGYTYTDGTSTVGGLVTGFIATPSTWS